MLHGRDGLQTVLYALLESDADTIHANSESIHADASLFGERLAVIDFGPLVLFVESKDQKAVFFTQLRQASFQTVVA